MCTINAKHTTHCTLAFRCGINLIHIPQNFLSSSTAVESVKPYIAIKFHQRKQVNIIYW